MNNCSSCGVEIPENQIVCSEGCLENLSKQPLEEQEDTSLIFEGDYFSIWRDEENIFLSLASPSVVLIFNEDEIDYFLGDMKNLLEMLSHHQ